MGQSKLLTRPNRVRWLLFLAAASLPLLGPAPAALAADLRGEFSLRVFFDFYLAEASPEAKTTFGGLATASAREGTASLDLGLLELSREPSPWGFTLIVGAGDELDAIHAGEKSWARDGFRNVFQASANWKREKIQLEVGLFPSHIGFESALPHLNWNYTHSWTAMLSPFYQTGIKVAFATDEDTTLELHLLNGWQQIADQAGGLTGGFKIAHRLGRISASLGGLYGDEPSSAGEAPRSLYDLILQAEIRGGFAVAAEAYRGHQDGKSWEALAGWLHWQKGRQALTLRCERFDDSGAGISGTEQVLESASLTFTQKLRSQARLFLELRRDHSTAAFFAGERRQNLGLVALTIEL